jgi:hypothetical protein
VNAVSFTAARTLSAAARESVVTTILTVRVPHAGRYVTGACVGGDAFIGRWLFYNRPDAEHVVIVPADRSRVDDWWTSASFTTGRPVTVIEMPPCSGSPPTRKLIPARGGAEHGRRSGWRGMRGSSASGIASHRLTRAWLSGTRQIFSRQRVTCGYDDQQDSRLGERSGEGMPV